MATTISILGGVGLFLLGMTVMTDGLKGLAGSALRAVLSKAAATPLRGSFWGAVVTLAVFKRDDNDNHRSRQRGLAYISAGAGARSRRQRRHDRNRLACRTHRRSRLAHGGGVADDLRRRAGQSSGASAAGAALAGFALVLFGLTTLQEGMGGLAERLHPADLPAVLAAPGAGWWSGFVGVLALVAVGLVMTAIMQSSTAAVAVTMSAHYAGAVGLD